MRNDLPQRKRLRLLNFDYSKDAIYFVTICSKERIHHFGKIENEMMFLNESGKIAYNQILWLQNQYKYINIHNFIIMPNHVHILIEIDRSRISINEISNIPPNPNIPPIILSNNIPIKIKSIPELIGAYKTTASKQIHLIGNTNFAWHKSYYDVIVRTPRRFHIIDNYITENPKRWWKDKFNCR